MFCEPRCVSPINPRASFYRSDGSGRDAYILRDSGGLIKGGFGPLGTSNIRSMSTTRGGFSRYDGKPIHYHSDGSGRDNYITVNSGGFARGGKTQDHFYSNLRSYDKCRSFENKDYFLWAQRGRKLKKLGEPESPTSPSKTQNKLVDRLSSPKKSYSKYVGEDDSPKFRISKTPMRTLKSMKSLN